MPLLSPARFQALPLPRISIPNKTQCAPGRAEIADFHVRGLSANLSGVDGETATSLAGLSVLVIEDEALLHRRLAAHLEVLGADVTGADSLAAARQLLAELDFDFALLDISLPDRSGMDIILGYLPALRYSGSLTPAGCPEVLVMLTPHGSNSRQRRPKLVLQERITSSADATHERHSVGPDGGHPSKVASVAAARALTGRQA